VKLTDVRNGLAIGLACSGLAGCERAHRPEIRPASKATEDPTSWAAPALTKGGEDPEATRSFSNSESLRGSLSKRGADIERSLGVGR